MPFFWSVPLPGPLRWARRMRRERPARPALASATSDLARIRELRSEADNMSTDVLRRRHIVGWVMAGLVSLLLLVASVWTLPVVLVILGVTYTGHERRHRRRAAVGVAARHRRL